MSIPNFQYFMLPVLQAASKGVANISEVVKNITKELNLSEEDKKITVSNGSSLLYTRVSWAKSYLVQAGLIESTGRGEFTITKEGIELLKQHPQEINKNMLKKYDNFNKFMKNGTKNTKKSNVNINEVSDLDELSPEEAIHQSIESVNKSLASELLARILKSTPEFFENLTIKLLIAMGYSNNTVDGWVHTGKSGDEGIDGIINQDVLGVDKIYIQAKRYSDSHIVTSGDLRDFIGALDMCRAIKGVFITTSGFTAEAKNTIHKSTKNIVLIDGEHLTELLIKYNVGCKNKEIINIKKIDEDFFEEM